MYLRHPETIGMTNIHLLKATWAPKKEIRHKILAEYVDDTPAAGNDEFINLNNKVPEQCKLKTQGISTIHIL